MLGKKAVLLLSLAALTAGAVYAGGRPPAEMHAEVILIGQECNDKRCECDIRKKGEAYCNKCWAPMRECENNMRKKISASPKRGRCRNSLDACFGKEPWGCNKCFGVPNCHRDFNNGTSTAACDKCLNAWKTCLGLSTGK